MKHLWLVLAILAAAIVASSACDRGAEWALRHEVARVAPDFCRSQCIGRVTDNIADADTLTLADHSLDSAIGACAALEDCCVRGEGLYVMAPCPPVSVTCAVPGEACIVKENP